MRKLRACKQIVRTCRIVFRALSLPVLPAIAQVLAVKPSYELLGLTDVSLEVTHQSSSPPV
jgi:hypothetical protein